MSDRVDEPQMGRLLRLLDRGDHDAALEVQRVARRRGRTHLLCHALAAGPPSPRAWRELIGVLSRLPDKELQPLGSVDIG